MKTALNLLLIACAFILLVISSCSKEEELNVPPGKASLTSPGNNSTDVALSEKLTWQAATDPDGDLVTYDVYFGTDASPATIASADQAGTSYTPTLSANTTYYWKITAKDPNGLTSQSATWSFSTLNNGPGVITLTAPDDAATDIALDASLTWEAVTDPDGDDIVYDVFLGADATPATIASENQAGTTYAPTLASGATYYWKIVAKDENGGSSESPIRSFTTINNAPGVVVLSNPTDAQTSVALDAILEWQEATDPDGDNVVYDVYFGVEADPVTVASADQTGINFTPTLSANTTYYWKIVAKDGKGGSTETAIWSFTTFNNAPGAVTLTGPVDEAIDVAIDADLTWEAAVDPDGDDVVYDVYFGTETDPVTLVSADQTALSYTPTLSIGTTYYWKVVAKDPNGGTSESAIWSFTAKIQIGDFYQGGVVFYIDETGIHGLICPITNQSPPSPAVHGGWGCANGVNIEGADGTAIDTGLQNTLDIIAACPTLGIAAEICASLKLNGYEDWYLPSIDELKAMNQQRNIITEYALANGGEDFVAHYYYSSSESTGAYAYAVYWPNGNTNQVGKANYNYPFRAVRAF